MKTIKRILALVLTMTMVLSIGAAAFAEDETPAAPDYSITVNNAKEGETYSAYKMFDLSVDDPSNPTAYRYTVNSSWEGFTETAEFRAVYSIDDQGYVTSASPSQETWDGTNDLSKVADAAAKFAKDPERNIEPAGSVIIAEGESSGKIELDEPGYYIITSTLGSRAMIETTPSSSAVTINEKNDADNIHKSVKEDSNGEWGGSNDAQIGDTVYFKSVVDIAARSVKVVIHDIMDDGLTLHADSIKVYLDANLTDSYENAVIKTGEAADEGDTFTIVIPDAFAADANAIKNLYIVYDAELNSNAVNGLSIVDQKNKTRVSFGDKGSSTWAETVTTTHKFSVLKYRSGDEEKKNLANAVFALEKNGVAVKLYKIDANNYRVVDSASDGDAVSHVSEEGIVARDNGSIVSDFITVEDGNIVIWGVDSDDDYAIREIHAPEGYNMLAEPVAVEVDVNNNNSSVLKVENNTGIELPSTGGIGTTIFYIVGIMLIICAGVMFILRRRNG